MLDRNIQVDEDAPEDNTDCEVCGRSDREDRLLLCDGCDLGCDFLIYNLLDRHIISLILSPHHQFIRNNLPNMDNLKLVITNP